MYRRQTSGFYLRPGPITGGSGGVLWLCHDPDDKGTSIPAGNHSGKIVFGELCNPGGWTMRKNGGELDRHEIKVHHQTPSTREMGRRYLHGSIVKTALLFTWQCCTQVFPQFRHGKAYKSVLQRHGKCPVCTYSCISGVFPKNMPDWGGFSP